MCIHRQPGSLGSPVARLFDNPRRCCGNTAQHHDTPSFGLKPRRGLLVEFISTMAGSVALGLGLLAVLRFSLTIVRCARDGRGRVRVQYLKVFVVEADFRPGDETSAGRVDE